MTCVAFACRSLADGHELSGTLPSSLMANKKLQHLCAAASAPPPSPSACNRSDPSPAQPQDQSIRKQTRRRDRMPSAPRRTGMTAFPVSPRRNLDYNSLAGSIGSFASEELAVLCAASPHPRAVYAAVLALHGSIVHPPRHECTPLPIALASLNAERRMPVCLAASCRATSSAARCRPMSSLRTGRGCGRWFLRLSAISCRARFRASRALALRATRSVSLCCG